MTPTEIETIDGSPSLTVIEDFCREFSGQFSTDLPSEWEPVEDHLLDSLQVPGEPEIVPFKAWRVVQGNREWMIYMWYEEPFGTDDDVYVYEEVRQVKP
jgi:hypothetical protein